MVGHEKVSFAAEKKNKKHEASVDEMFYKKLTVSLVQQIEN